MFGRILKSKAEIEAELEAERKKQRTEETPSEIASIIDDMAIEVSFFNIYQAYINYFFYI